MKFFGTITTIIKSTHSVSGIYNIIIVYNTFKYIFVNSKEDFFHFVKELQRLRDLESEGHVGCLEIPRKFEVLLLSGKPILETVPKTISCSDRVKFHPG